MKEPINKGRLGRLLVAPAMVGALVGGFAIAGAQTDTTSGTTPTTTVTEESTTTTAAPTQSTPSTQSTDPTPPAASGPSDRPGGGNGETALTGDTAEKVKAAALKAVPGGTVDRVETDSDGSPYEAHVTKADGSHVTVKVNEQFEVTAIETDHEGGDHHGGRPGGGTGETALTGETADKVKAAAQKAVPDGTVERVETDSEGSPYEAHVTKADGSHVTVKVNENFEVTSIENEPARPPRG